jgi:uncharacterized membrane protein
MDIPVSDFIGLIWLIVLWVGYTVYVDRGKPREYSLRAAMHKNRYRWMTQILRREARIVDASILAQLSQGASFFASTTLLILVGLFTLLGSTDEAVVALRQIPFTGKLSLLQWELRLLVLIVIFVHAFFKFTWSMRQFNYCGIMLGAAPAKAGSEDEEFVERTAWLSTLAMKDFNQGLRAYYFAMAVPAWFANVWIFMGTTVLVVVVLYHREFHSAALRTLEYQSKQPRDYR